MSILIYEDEKKKYLDSINKEIHYLRELASSVAYEQEKILHNDTKGLSDLLPQREGLLQDLVKIREQRLRAENLLKNQFNDEWKEDRDIVHAYEQLKELLSKTHNQSFRNSYLLKSKVIFTRSLFNKLQPESQHATYGADGVKGKKAKVSTLTIINKEV